jgi:hypothetical protein
MVFERAARGHCRCRRRVDDGLSPVNYEIRESKTKPEVQETLDDFGGTADRAVDGEQSSRTVVVAVYGQQAQPSLRGSGLRRQFVE